MTFSQLTTYYRLASDGPVIASRPTGRLIREKLESALNRLPVGGMLRLDLNGIVAISPSAADELLGRIYSALQAGEYGNRLVVLEGVTSDHEQVLEPILKRRAVFAAKTGGRSVSLIGAPAHLSETYRIARRLKQFRASDLASRLNLSVPAADNRLAKLLRNHLLRRDSAPAKHGGREYVYRVSV